MSPPPPRLRAVITVGLVTTLTLRGWVLVSFHPARLSRYTYYVLLACLRLTSFPPPPFFVPSFFTL